MRSDVPTPRRFTTGQLRACSRIRVVGCATLSPMTSRKIRRRNARLRAAIDTMPEIPQDILDTMGPEFQAQWREAQAQVEHLRELIDEQDAEP